MNTSNYEELMAELRGEYLESFEEKFSVLRTLFNDQNWESIELEYHKLKGTGATYGVPEVTTLCQYLENILGQKKGIDQETLNLSIELLSGIKERYLNQAQFELAEHPGFLKIQELSK